VFVGRTDEARRIESAFQSGQRLVTLKGPGGVGKTRLARETLDGWPEGEAVFFCDLVEVHTLPGLLLAMTSALGIPLLADSREEQVRQVGHALAEAGPGLVVLDNLEQVVQVVAPALETWIQTALDTRFLATSRQRIGLAAEQVVELGPLSQEEGRELFQERIPIARRDSTLALLTPAVLDEIVTRLDAMPLALELAAAWVGLVMPDELLAGLKKRFRMLRGGKRGAREKDATLEGTLDWSWNLLEPWEQDALAQLSVFRGGFTLESAGSVLDLTSHADAPWVLHVVESLYDKSLVFSRPTESGPRFGLYESIREYVGARLEALGGKSDNRARFARIRHAEYISSLGAPSYLATLNRAGGNEARQVLVTEIENLLEAASTGFSQDRPQIATQAALAAVAALEAIGPLELALDVVEKALGMRGLADIQRTQLLSAQGRLLHLLGKTEEGIEAGLLAVAALEDLDSVEVEVEVRFHLYLQFLQFGKLEEARLQLRAGLEKAGAQESVTAPLHEGLGVWHLSCGEYHEAALQLHDALLISREAGDWNTESLVLSDLGKLRREQGLQEEAERFTLESLARYRESGDIFMEGRELSSLSLLYQELGRMDDARTATHKALELARRVGDVRSTASILSNQAILYQTRGLIEEAFAHYLEALALQRLMNDVRGQGITLGNLGALEMDHGDPERALEHLHKALKLHEKLKNRRFIAMTWGNIGDCHLRCDRRAEARAALEKSISMTQKVGWGAAEGAFRGVLSDLESQEDNLAKSMELAKRAEELLKAAGHAIELSKVRCRLAHLLLRTGDRDAAKEFLDHVEEQCQSMGIQPDSALGKRISKLRSAF
jgi:predicted ATPase/Tfp pilus assembly protein PilF